MANDKAKSVEVSTEPPSCGRITTLSQRIAISAEEAAAAAGVGRTTIFKAMKDGELKGHKVGRRTVILVEDFHAWLASLPFRSATKRHCEKIGPISIG